MKTKRTLAILLAVLLTATLFSGCGGKTKPQESPFLTHEIVQNAIICYAFEIYSLEDIYTYYSPEGKYGSENYALVRLEVTGTPKNMIGGEYSTVPVRIQSVYFANANVDLSEGDEVSVRESYYVDEQNDRLVCHLRTTPLVEGHAFYAVIWQNPETGVYAIEHSYPVEPYQDFPEFKKISHLQNERLRNELVLAYGSPESDRIGHIYRFDTAMDEATDRQAKGEYLKWEHYCTDPFTQKHATDRALVRLRVLRPERYTLIPLAEQDADRYDHKIEKTLEILEVYQASEAVPLQVDDRITVYQPCLVAYGEDGSPEMISEYFVENPPMVEGYEYFAYVWYDPKAEQPYYIKCGGLIPVDGYASLPGCSGNYPYKREAVHTSLRSVILNPDRYDINKCIICQQ